MGDGVDALSEVLQAIKFTGGIFLDARFTDPWSVSAKITPEDCRPYLERSDQVIAYHYIVAGRLVVQVDGEAPVEARAGEIVLLPRNDEHVLSSAPGLRPLRADDLIRASETGGLARIDWGGGGAPTHLVCGFLGSAEMRHPLIATLPRVLTQNVGESASRALVEASVRFAAQELASGRLASSAVMSRLSEMLFVEAVRSYAATLPDGQAGWLKGVKDPYVGRALALMHGSPGAPWTTEALAAEVALSRSAFADRFTALVGMPPMRYLTSWRLELAGQALRAGRSIARVAAEAGYESEASFSRAFKRAFGASPATWRRQQSGATGATV